MVGIRSVVYKREGERRGGEGGVQGGSRSCIVARGGGDKGQKWTNDVIFRRRRRLPLELCRSALADERGITTAASNKQQEAKLACHKRRCFCRRRRRRQQHLRIFSGASCECASVLCVRAVVVSHRRMRSSVTPSGHSSHNREQDKNNKIIKYLKGGNFPWRPTSPASFNNPASIIKRSQILSFIHAGHYRLPAEMGRRQRRSRRSRNLIDFTPRYLVSLFPLFQRANGIFYYFTSKSGSTGKIFFLF